MPLPIAQTLLQLDRHSIADTACHYVRSRIRQEAGDVLAVNGKENHDVSDKLTKGYESIPPHIKEIFTAYREFA